MSIKEIKRKVAFTVVMAIFISSFMFVVNSPSFGSFNGYKETPQYYISNALKETGAANAVSAIVWDYRGFDTLGEETVLFTSLVAIFTVLMIKKD
ncbi:MAG: hypothetical protein GXO64_02540 [Candidatus Micrarchaeota archaeon]|nr:hypothetical protein [Candidatus Micrarchaeota archaeon]